MTRVGLLLVAILYMFIMVGCGGAPNPDGMAAQPLPQGTVTATGNPLVAQYTISPPAQSTVTVEFGLDQSYLLSTSPVSSPAGGGAVTVLVAGMTQNTLYHMRAMVTHSDGSQQFDSDHTFHTGVIPPQRLPNITVTTASGATPTPGVELVSLTTTTANQLTCLATNPVGDIIWYYDYSIPNEPSDIPQPIKLLHNGHMLMILYSTGVPGGRVREIDLAGNIIRELTYTDVNQKLSAAGYNIQVFSIDHDFVALPNGHLLLILTDTRVFTDLPGYPGRTTVLGNAIVDLDPNLNPVWVWDAFDHLDINRHPLYFPDWLHSNAIAYSPDDGNLLLSIRHQSWVVKIAYQNGNGSGDILWRLGDGGDFVLNPDSSGWFYAQHDANIASSNSTGDFRVALFDNGNFREGLACSLTGPPLCYSAPAIFEVNETTMTANRQWSFTTPYSFWGGATRVLPNGNVFLDQTAPSDLAPAGSHVMEVTQDPNPAILWHMQITGQDSYRTIHIPSLYPGVQW